jgi:hypothetical protein
MANILMYIINKFKEGIKRDLVKYSYTTNLNN